MVGTLRLLVWSHGPEQSHAIDAIVRSGLRRLIIKINLTTIVRREERLASPPKSILGLRLRTDSHSTSGSQSGNSDVYALIEQRW